MKNDSMPDKIELTKEEYEGLMKRLENDSLTSEDKEVIRSGLKGLVWITEEIFEGRLKMKKLQRLLFGPGTEKRSEIIKEPQEGNNNKEGSSSSTVPAKKIRGNNNGKNGVEDYPGARIVEMPVKDNKAGDRCPLCGKGNLYEMESGSFIHVKGSAPLNATVFVQQKLRCSGCGEITTADLPDEVKNKERYDETAVATVSILKYNMGVPFHRLARIQKLTGVPCPESTQWDIVEGAGDNLHPIYNLFLKMAANSALLHVDDTKVKILDCIKENKLNLPERKGMFTTGITTVVEGHKICIYMTGRNHAGENLDSLAELRLAELSPPMQMCDALSRNLPKVLVIILLNCLSHARRNFVDLYEDFPVECKYVIDALAEVYKNDDYCASTGLKGKSRLDYHVEHSGPIMQELNKWMDTQFEERKVEPNSSLGGAINYMKKHWTALTGFLKLEDAPLDNNVVERALKHAILNRKNAYFFRSELGARIGDIHISILATCAENKVHPFDYYVALLKNKQAVRLAPEKWLPWNYKSNL
jgi:transposase